MGPPTATKQRVTASSAPATPVFFSATATAGAPKSVVKQIGDNQEVATGTAVSIKPAVLVKDQFGNPVANATVSFVPGMSSGSVTGGVVLTTMTGVATVGGRTGDINPGPDTFYA